MHEDTILAAASFKLNFHFDHNFAMVHRLLGCDRLQAACHDLGHLLWA